jgi:AraC-like DNA-binding protein
MSLIAPPRPNNPRRSPVFEPIEARHPIEELRPIFVEELAQLRPILVALGLVVAHRAEGESTPRVIYAPNNTDMSVSGESLQSVATGAPLFGPRGGRVGCLEFLRAYPLPGDGSTVVLEPLLRLAATAISERWFRLHHCEHWVIATAPMRNLDQGLLLAIDEELELQAVGLHTGHECPLWKDLFAPISPTPTLRARTDVTLRLTGAVAGEPWVALLTGPALRRAPRWSSDAFAHAKPRLHQLAAINMTLTDQTIDLPSLTAGMRRRVEEFIEANLDMPLSVEQIARTAGMSASYFTRAFNNVMKMTPHRYVMWRRVIRAHELIRNSDASLAEIALVAGFADQSHLCRLFQEHTGESPSRFRRRHR